MTLLKFESLCLTFVISLILFLTLLLNCVNSLTPVLLSTKNKCFEDVLNHRKAYNYSNNPFDNENIEKPIIKMVLTGRVETLLQLDYNNGILKTSSDDSVDDGSLSFVSKYSAHHSISVNDNNNQSSSSEAFNRALIYNTNNDNNNHHKSTNSNIKVAIHVRVKRVIKGDRSLQNTIIVINGLSPISKHKYCIGRLRIRDTRIFFLALDSESNFIFSARPLQLTLQNLQNLKLLKDEPCEQKYCAFGANCIVENGKAVCRCPDSCADGYVPVCGTDDVTYANECILRKVSCKHQKTIRVRKIGECTDKNDPCIDKICQFGSHCVSSENGETGVCECPAECPEYKEEIESDNIICGSDGKHYQNECELNRHSCLIGHAIAMKYLGKCDPCEKMSCTFPSTCQLDVDRNPICRCTEVCSMEFHPVCASNGRSYTNECIMRQEACKTRNELHILYRGECSSGVNPCDSITCKGYESCIINRFGIAQCECAMICDAIVQPVCGSNGETYDNYCQLTLSSCQESKQVNVAYPGTCGIENSDVCAKHNCQPEATCKIQNGEPICECPSCPSDYDPICGTNGISYQNLCQLRFTSCTTNTPIQILHAGLCNKCEDYQCGFYSTCETDTIRPKCICPQQNCNITTNLNEPNLDLETSSVCGSDGQIYGNECELQKYACAEKKLITVESMDHCDLCANVQCKFGAKCEVGICKCPTNCPTTYDPVCGSNFETFSNECELQQVACSIGRTISVLFYGVCSERYSKGAETEIGKLFPESELLNYNCSENVNGCCPDGVTPALNNNENDCPLSCKCNKLGSMSETCDFETKECECLTGIGGENCDRCLPGFWGFPRVVSDPPQGCSRCECSKFGSVRDDCEQMTGQCVCKAGVFGHKCEECRKNEFLGPQGCISDTALQQSCEKLFCSYGAECKQIDDQFECICNIQCNDEFNSKVCGNDGLTYESTCKMNLQSCREQKPIWVVKNDSCFYSDLNEFDEDSGVKTMLITPETKQQPEYLNEGVQSYGMKSTRHLSPQLIQSNYHDNFQRSFFNHRLSVPSTIEMKSYLGDSCQMSSECVTTFSICLNEICICKEGYFEDSERIQCKPTQYHAPKPIVCTNVSCHSSSKCLDHLNGSYSCVCSFGTANNNGNGCTEPENPLSLFTGKSTIYLRKLAGYHKLSLEVEITPYLDNEYGIIIFASQYANGTGDFVSLALIDGFVEFRFDLGDGPAVLRSISRLQSGTSYFVAAKRYNRDGLLQINDDEEIKGSSPGIVKSLNLDFVGYMGHVPLNSTMIWEIVGTSQGLVGCIQSLRVGRRPVDFLGTKDPLINSFHQIEQCLSGIKASTPLPSTTTSTTTPISVAPVISKTSSKINVLPVSKYLPNSVSNNNNVISVERKNPCSKIPCKNNGHCWIDNSQRKGFKCVCHPQFSGKLCETKIASIQETGAMIDFRGSSYLQLSKIENSASHITIEIWVMLRSLNGLILYNGQFAGTGDYIALNVLHGHIQFLYNLGSGMGNLTYDKPVSLNKWHWIYVTRNGREAKLQIDGEFPQITKSPPTLSELNLELPLYVGGIKDVNILHRELGILTPFDGVFQYMKVNGMTYHRQITNAVIERLVHKYEGPPCGSSISDPCSNGGTCFPRLSSFSCLCPTSYTGVTCENRKQLPGPVRFDGENYIKFPRKIVKRSKVQRQNRIEIVFRTTSESAGVLLWIGKPLYEESRKRGYLGLFLTDDGYLELRIHLGAIKNKKPVIIRSKVKVKDGRWHQALIVRERRFIVFQVDGSSPQRETAPVGSNVLHSDGRIWIGGVGTSMIPGEIPPKYHSGLKGCVDLVRLEKKKLPLSNIAYATGNPFCNDDD